MVGVGMGIKRPNPLPEFSLGLREGIERSRDGRCGLERVTISIMDENPYKSPETGGAPVRSKRRGIPLYILIVGGILIASAAITLLDALYVDFIVRNSTSNPP
jgi:hypothetical protein